MVLYLQPRLPYYMIPSLFVPLPTLPLTPSGKIDRKALPDPAQSAAQVEHVAPRNQVETQLAEIWSKTLSVEVTGVKQDFFSLGGHSLALMSTLAVINQHFGGNLSLQDFLENPTVEALAAKIQAAEETLLESDEAAEMLAQLGDLSPEEIQLLLEAEKGA